MKIGFLFATLLLVLGARAEQRVQKLDFAAPIVQNHATLPSDTPFGTIIYDYSNANFMGLNSSGSWVPFGGGANTSLSNLSSTAVNANILPATSGSVSLGDAGHSFSSVNANDGHFSGNIAIGSSTFGFPAVISPNFYAPTGDRALQFRSPDPINYPDMYLMSSDGANIVLFTSGSGAIVTPNHIRSTNSGLFGAIAPTATASGNVGGSGNCSISTSTDVAGKVTILTSGSGIVSGDQCAVNFGRNYPVSPICTLTPSNSAAGANSQQVYVTSSSSAMTINFGVAGANGSTYIYNYHCIEVN